MPLPAVATTVLKLFIPQIPALIRASAQAYDKIRNRERPQKSHCIADSDNIQVLRSALNDIQGRLEMQEDATEAQAELIVQLTRHNAILGRWLLFTVIGLVLSIGVAIAALSLTMLR